MGLYPIECSGCKKGFLWFSGNLDTRCPDCVKKAEQETEMLDQMDRQINKTRMSCGHQPCQLGHCKGCDHHCGHHVVEGFKI